MALSLKFDADSFYEDLKSRLVVVMDDLNREFYREATSGMRDYAKADTEIEKAVVESFSDYEGASGTEFINARCKFYALAILESYGIGSLADASDMSYWEDYILSDFYNPARYGTRTIVGRDKGPYTNIFGERQESSGQKDGENLEGTYITGKNGNKMKIEPKYGSHSIQHAEAFIMQDRETKIERRIKMETEKFIAEEASKYFYMENN